jgi:hypothetical protein
LADCGNLRRMETFEHGSHCTCSDCAPEMYRPTRRHRFTPNELLWVAAANPFNRIEDREEQVERTMQRRESVPFIGGAGFEIVERQPAPLDLWGES